MFSETGTRFLTYFTLLSRHFSKTSRLPQERIDLIQKLATESDIYERLARAIGKRKPQVNGNRCGG